MKKKKNRLISGVICGILIVVMVLPLFFMTGCGKMDTAKALKNDSNTGALCQGVTVFDNDYKGDKTYFEYHGYVVSNTALEWFLSSEYESEINDVISGDFKTAFEYLGTTYVVFDDEEKSTAIIVYDGDEEGTKYIQLADNFRYDVHCVAGSDDGAPAIDYTDCGLYLYGGTNITKFS